MVDASVDTWDTAEELTELTLSSCTLGVSNVAAET
jgi:hypothetical protein